MRSISIKIFAALLSGCFFLSACENDEDVVNNINKKKSLSVEEARNVVINYTLGGKIKTILKSPLMLRVQDTVVYIEFPKTLVANFYNDKGVADSKLTALYGKYKENESIIYLRDSVVVISFEKGDTLLCDELYWDRNRVGAEFYTDKRVRIRTKTQVIDGMGMEAALHFKDYLIKHVTGVIAVPAANLPQ
jgi:LPS export ABC transporter protein LptC